MSDHYEFMKENKIELLQACNDSFDIFRSLDDQVSEYRASCNTGTFAVYDEPYCGPWYIECHIDLLSDLQRYTECVRYDKEMPEDLLYLVNYVDF